MEPSYRSGPKGRGIGGAVAALVILLPFASCRTPGPTQVVSVGDGNLIVGGRGGDVYHVENTEDRGTGSLREGVETTAGPRTIVFDVGGIVVLQTPLVITQSHLTIAGQSPPGDGVMLRNHGVVIDGAENVILAALRVCPGEDQTEPALVVRNSRRVLLTHLTLARSAVALVAINGSENVELSDSLLARSGASQGTLAVGEGVRNLQLHRNLFALNGGPPVRLSASTSGVLDLRGNVTPGQATSGEATGPQREEVLNRAGVSHSRDVADREVVFAVQQGHPPARSLQEVTDGWPRLRELPTPEDTDRDGMPDTWEAAHGLNPHDSLDRNHAADATGRTQLERYLQDCGRPITVADFTPAYPPSPVIAGVTFDDTTERIEAPGSDIWPMTWSANDQLFTAWGDGGGFGGSNSSGRVKLGVARIDGGPRDYKGGNIAGGFAAPNPAPFPGKSEGMLALGNTLYLWQDNDKSKAQAGYFTYFELWRSDDLGQTWNSTGLRFDVGEYGHGDAGMFAPAFCQFGPGYAGAQDDYVYVYAPDIVDGSHWHVREPGRINLMRVRRDLIEVREAYEFYAGTDVTGLPRWTPEIAARQPVWEDPQGTQRMAVSYNAGLKRYLLTTVTKTRQGWMSIYDAPTPWGPWTHVHTEFNQDRWGGYTIIFSFVNKWLSTDGRDFVMVHTKDDHWASIEGHFELPATLRAADYR